MQCLLHTVGEAAAAIAAEHKSDDLGGMAKNLHSYLLNACSFLQLCSSEVSSIDCQQDVPGEWETLWQKVMSQSQVVMTCQVTAKPDTHWVCPLPCVRRSAF